MDFKKDFLKYLKHWPWFVLSLAVFIGAAYFYIGEVSPSYETTALINFDITKDQESEVISTELTKEIKEKGIAPEIMYMTSNGFLTKIVTDLKLNINSFEKGDLRNKVLYDVPFVIKPNIPNDSLPEVAYNVKIVKRFYSR